MLSLVLMVQNLSAFDNGGEYFKPEWRQRGGQVEVNSALSMQVRGCRP